MRSSMRKKRGEEWCMSHRRSSRALNPQREATLGLDGYFLMLDCISNEDPQLDCESKADPPLDLDPGANPPLDPTRSSM